MTELVDIPESTEVVLHGVRCVSVAVAAEVLGTSRSHVYNLVREEPRLQAVWSGRRVGIPVEALLAYVKAGGSPPPRRAPRRPSAPARPMASARTRGSASTRRLTAAFPSIAPHVDR